jgi:hypothetical protein
MSPSGFGPNADMASNRTPIFMIALLRLLARRIP